MTQDALPKILVVDDEPFNVELMEAILAAQYDVISAYSGEEALEKLAVDPPDLILLDIMMPQMNGYEVCKVIREDEKTQFIPVIMVTALAERDDRIKGIEAGADDFLTKPVNKTELTTRVRSLIRVKQLHDSLVNERDKLNMQNHIRGILTSIIPVLLQPLPDEHKKIVIHQMTDMVEKNIMELYQFESSDPQQVGIICSSVMNQLGGDFISEIGEDNICRITGTVCPWGDDEAAGNPILCNLTRGVFTRIASRAFSNAQVEVIGTIGNGDEKCVFEIMTN
jgi:response regulator RpfG family c-di-GMP phosphodiesterase